MRKRRSAGQSMGSLSEPVGDALEIECGSRKDMLECGFGQADIARTTQARGA
jgi:hypothetical protein